MSMFLKESKEDVRAEKYVEAITKIMPDSPEDIFKIAVTLCELKQHEQAIKYLSELIDINPYDENVLFYLAMAYYNTRHWKQAQLVLADIKKLDYPGVIAQYYIEKVHRVAEHREEFKTLGYIYQVPLSEAKNKMNYLNECTKMSEYEFLKTWREDESLYNTVLWGLEYGDLNIKLAIAHMISEIADKKAEKILRDYILKKGQPDSVKKEIFGLLSKMGAREPYTAYINGEVVEIDGISKNDYYNIELSENLKKVIDILKNEVKEEYSNAVIMNALDIIHECSLKRVEKEFTNDIPAFVAALVYLSIQRTGEVPNVLSISEKFNVSCAIIPEVVEQIKKCIEEELKRAN